MMARRAKRVDHACVALWMASVVLWAFAAVGCKEFDPVKSDDLCRQGLVVSSNCPQCRGELPAAECSQCQGDNPPVCGPPTITDSVMVSDGGGTAGNGSTAPDGTSGTTGASGDGAGGDGTSGSGASGDGAGGDAGPPSPTQDEIEDGMVGCQSDRECMRKQPQSPVCDPIMKSCVECLTNDHCAGTMRNACDIVSHRCQDCVEDSDCATGACDEQRHICVECKDDDGCNQDSTLNQCNVDKFSCVDCTDDMGCDDAKPACDGAMGECFECLEDTHCTEEPKRSCDKSKRACVDCVDDRGCMSDNVNNTCNVAEQVCVDCMGTTGCIDLQKPVCDPAASACVQCLKDSDCESGHCKEDDQTCVACEADTDCTMANRSRCSSTTNMCAPCSQDSQCRHVSGKPACASGECVECTDDSDCGGTACLRSRHTCSDVPVMSKDACAGCEADSMCKANMKCVPQRFGGQSLGSFCLYTKSSRGSCASASARPFSEEIQSASVDGPNAAFCAPTYTTTCPGLLDALSGRIGKDCAVKEDCGAGIGDAVCDVACTYTCRNPQDCGPAKDCNGGGLCG